MVRLIMHCLLSLKRHVLGQLAAKECAFILSHLEDDAVCIDIGAHCGAWTLPLSAKVIRGHVFSIEALPYYARLLRMLLRLLGRRNVTVLNCAATETVCELQLVWRDENGRRLTGLTHLAGRVETTANTITVRGRPLHDIVARELWPKIGFIKCDVEGAELQVFKGARRLLEAARPWVYSEIDDTFCRRYGHTAADVFQFFTELGYQAFLLDAGNCPRPVVPASYSGKGDVLFIVPST